MHRWLPLFLLLLASCGGESAPDVELPEPLPGARVVSLPTVPWATVTEAQLARANFLGIPAAFENAHGMRFVYIPGGAFEMGSPHGETGRADDEHRHEVTLTTGYYLQVQPVSATAFGQTGAGPAVGVSWSEATAFAEQLSQDDDTWSYRLPTEAEWEHGCRAGSDAAFSWGAKPQPVETEPNVYGLRDMHVGIREWCKDRYAPLPSWAVGDPLGPRAPEGDGYVIRGGGTPAQPARSAQRSHAPADTTAADLGFRLVVPVGYGLGRYGSVHVTFQLTDPKAGGRPSPPDPTYDLRIIKMNDRLSARMAGTETDWKLVKAPTLPLAMSMVPGKYYVYAETRRNGVLVRGREIKFHVWGQTVDVPVPVPERDLGRYGSGGHEKPQ